MKEELKREIEENGYQDTAFYDVYKTSTGLYVIEDICNHFSVGNKEDQKEIKGYNCYRVTEEDLEVINKESSTQEVRLIPNIVTIFDLQLVLTFTVYKDINHDNKLYVVDGTCQRYNIEPKSKRSINGATCCEVNEEDITRIEEATSKEKIAFKRKYVEVELNDAIKPAEFLFIYYFDYETQKQYVRRDTYEMLKTKGMEIEGIPKIIDNKNCYSITEKELRDIEMNLNYRGVEQLLRPKMSFSLNKRVDYPHEEEIKAIVEQIYEFKKRKKLFEKAMPYEEKTFNDIAKPYNKKAFEEVVMPYIEKVMPYSERVMPYYEKVMPYEEKETGKEIVLVYKDARENKMYVPTKYINKDQKPTKVMNKDCFEITAKDFDNFINKKIIIADTYLILKKEYNILICNNNGQLFISESILPLLGFYIDNPYRIKVNGEIYDEITEEDLELIKSLESDELHLNITVKQIAPKRG